MICIFDAIEGSHPALSDANVRMDYHWMGYGYGK